MTSHSSPPDPAASGERGRPTSDDRVRASERRRLARELHDTATHHLANVALRTMGQLEQVDPGCLRGILHDVHDSASAALAELHLLARVLADEPGGAAVRVRELSQDILPTRAAATWRRRLEQAGLVAVHVVPASADLLPRSVQHTLTRAFETTGQTVLRGRVADGARCSLVVRVEPGRVVVQLTAVPPPHRDLLDELPAELVGLRERVELTFGRFDAAVTAGASGVLQWVVTVVVPLD